MTDDTDRQAIRSAEMEVDVDDDIETTAHRGWDRNDYTADDLGDFSGIDPDEVDWHDTLDRIRQRLADLPSERERTPHERQVARDLRRREEKIEAHLEGGSE